MKTATPMRTRMSSEITSITMKAKKASGTVTACNHPRSLGLISSTVSRSLSVASCTTPSCS
jgi:hypothetical protein